ncbi:hypothetical protein ACQFN5_12040 [Klebsiella sp. WOUb02]|uniref:hypothetical protein n=1 Tax=Klebsiella sp. WOUb02 TaxID=3161071 RepID=UPI003CF06E16
MMRFSLIVSVISLVAGCSLPPEHPDYGQVSGSGTIVELHLLDLYRAPGGGWQEA